MLRNLRKILSKYQTFHTEDSKLFMENIWITILSSAGIASIISAIVGYAFNVLMQKRRYKDDYYKMVIAKRMDAYSKTEQVCKLLKTHTYDNETEGTYCIAFGSMDALLTLCKMMHNALSDNIWLSDSIHAEMQKLNNVIVGVEDGCRTKGFNVKQIGIELYADIDKVRINIENQYAKDMLTLHDVEGFLKSKNKKNK